ncbi:hypothetical protein HYALB_00005426 [Hymenoscyphus albidus]|uniref:DUF7371 domain-containing protein n=1 Tax=Hymenoscyphus albidus TaxID=595503 RepID=A0A9N9LE65_9HELO|nr:hypothetical protein HYALB_00005426 [Hymenoscyphus albidus]
MRLTSFTVAGIVANAAAAPALSSVDCAAAPSITTIYLSSEPSTITVHDAPTNTVYVSGAQQPASEYHAHQPSSYIASSEDVISYQTDAVTLTVEPVPHTSTDPQGHTVVSSGETTIYITQHVTVTGTLSALGSALSTATAPSFALTAPGGWNGTAGPYHSGPTASSGAQSNYTFTAKLATPTSFAAQDGFGGVSVDPSIVTSQPTIDVYSSVPVVPLPTMAAQSGFNALTTSTSLYSNTSFTDPQATTSYSLHYYSTLSSEPVSATSKPSLTLPLLNSTTALPSSSSFVTSVSSSGTASHANSTATVSGSNYSNSTTVAPTIIPTSSAQPTAQSSTSVTSLNQSSTSASSTPSTLATACGEIGDFGLNFDDIPPLSVGDQDPNTVTPQPVFSPYHQFDWSNGFEVVPPPTDPYLPSSPPQLTMFVPNFTLNFSNPSTGPNAADMGFAGDIANGDHDRTGCFRFNFYGASVGCDSRGPDCVFKFTGLRYDSVTGANKQVAQGISRVPACPALENCSLVPITLSRAFKDLTVIRVSLTVGGQPKIWFMDDLRMGWSDNSCATGVCRRDAHLRKRQLSKE